MTSIPQKLQRETHEPAVVMPALKQLRIDMEILRTAVVGSTQPSDVSVDSAHSRGASNLDHYLALRSSDLRPLQTVLTSFGLSSLGRSESNVLATIDAVLRAVRALLAADMSQGVSAARPPTIADDGQDSERNQGNEGIDILALNTASLLGPRPSMRQTRIMVTMPTEAASDPAFVASLVDHGLDVARINCAHDDSQTWRSIAKQVRDAAVRSNHQVQIIVDLAGPKLRTGAIAPLPPVVRVRPVRNTLGRVVTAGRVTLVAADPSPSRTVRPGCVPVDQLFLERLDVDDVIKLDDARDSRRHLIVESISGSEVQALVMKTTYFTNDVELRVGKHLRGKVKQLPPQAGFVTLHNHDVITLGNEHEPTSLEGPIHLGCTLPEAVSALRPGHRVFFDDGKFEAEVLHVDEQRATLRVVDAPIYGGKLRAEKGINLPDTEIPVSALTDKDIKDLADLASFADGVSLSFVRTAQDVETLHDALDAIGADHLGVVLKIETGDAFRNLPALLRVAMRRKATGVMIARGDLAVEAGYERLAEMQEEILWLCEAAHLPVIWATQVLDTLARTGTPSRAEVTDAAASQRAECVMLNKGPFILHAVSTLDDILRRMDGHQDKKRPLLRQLRSWT
jgi:pyruvate kinase